MGEGGSKNILFGEARFITINLPAKRVIVEQRSKFRLMGLADAKLLECMPQMSIFDDNVAEVLFSFENSVIEAPLKPRDTFLDLFWKNSRKIAEFGVSKGQKECIQWAAKPVKDI